MTRESERSGGSVKEWMHGDIVVPGVAAKTSTSHCPRRRWGPSNTAAVGRRTRWSWEPSARLPSLTAAAGLATQLKQFAEDRAARLQMQLPSSALRNPSSQPRSPGAREATCAPRAVSRRAFVRVRKSGEVCRHGVATGQQQKITDPPKTLGCARRGDRGRGLGRGRGRRWNRGEEWPSPLAIWTIRGCSVQIQRRERENGQRMDPWNGWDGSPLPHALLPWKLGG